MINKNLTILFWLSYLLNTFVYAERLVQTDYGIFMVTEPVLEELFDCSAMQRLTKIHQYGVSYFTKSQDYWYSRYEHSVGVWAILRKFGASLEEQIAGLLHDVSHTVFSHVGDLVFKGENAYRSSSYQDDIHEWYLHESGIDTILGKYTISVDAVLPKCGQHCMLEQDLPDICADRLEYNLKGGVLEGLITSEQRDAILADICFREGKWFFHSPDLARLFASISLFHTQYIWAAPDQALVYTWAADALKRAIDIGLMTIDDLHFSTDQVIWELLCSSSDEFIQKKMMKVKSAKNSFVVTQSLVETPDFIVKSKFRGIDPLVQRENVLCRLTEIDNLYAEEYSQVKEIVTQGWMLRFIDNRNKI